MINKESHVRETIIVILTNDGKGNVYLSQDENSITGSINGLKKSFLVSTPIVIPYNNSDRVFEFEDRDYQYKSVNKL